MDSEASARTLLVGGTVVIVAIVAALLVFGYFFTVVRERNRTVLAVEDTKISYVAMKRRMEYEFLTNTSLTQQPELVPEYAYQSLLNELTLIQRAESELGVTVTEEELQTRLRVRAGLTDADSQQFAEGYARALKSSRLTDAEFRRLVKAQVLEEKARQYFQAQAPAKEQQAKLEVIATADQDTARQAINRLRFGESWDSVAKALSEDPQAASNGGLIDFAPRDSVNPIYRDYAFSAPIGEISDPPIEGSATVFVVRVVERKEADLTDPQKANFAQTRLTEWLQNMQTQISVVDKWDTPDQTDALDSVIKSVGNEVLRRQQEQQQQQQPPPIATVPIPPEGEPPAVPTGPAQPPAASPVP